MKIAQSTGTIPKEYEKRPDLFFDYLNGAEFIKRIRAPRSGKLNVATTAKRLGISLSYDLTELKGKLSVVDGLIEGLGTEKGKRPIVIRIKPTAKNPLLTFAHEVGHYFLDFEKNYSNYYPDQAVEDFCEFFANRLLQQK